MTIDARLLRRITAAALIAAPLVFLVANVLHPKEYTRDHELQQLQTIGENYTRWQLTHFITFVAVLLFVLAVAGLAWLIARRRLERGLIGGTLGILGLVAIGGVVALDGTSWGVLGEIYTRSGVDQRTVFQAMKSIQNSYYTLPYYVGSLAWLIGLVILATGAVRSGLAPAWAGWTLALGAVLVGIEAAVENNVYFVIAAAVLAIGGVGVGTAIGRQDQEAVPA